MNDPIKTSLIEECRRQEESCLYTSTTLYVWLREARIWKAVFTVVPIVLGSIASWTLLTESSNQYAIWFAALAGLVAGLTPAIRDALHLDPHVEEIALQASEFKRLQDRFRIAANTGAGKSVTDLEVEVRDLMERLDGARKSSVTPPERCFVAAREKIKEGHYSFSVDEKQK